MTAQTIILLAEIITKIAGTVEDIINNPNLNVDDIDWNSLLKEQDFLERAEKIRQTKVSNPS